MKGLAFRKHIKAGFDIVLLLRAGIDVFDSNPATARKSFILPVLLIPFSLLFTYFQTPIGMDDLPEWRIQLVVLLQQIIPWCLFLLLVYWFAGVLDRRDRFFKFVSAYNWTTTASSIITMPFIPLRAFDVISEGDMTVFGVIITCYGYVLSAFIACRALDIPWSLAAFVSISGMFIAESFWDVLYITQGLPPPP